MGNVSINRGVKVTIKDRGVVGHLWPRPWDAERGNERCEPVHDGHPPRPSRCPDLLFLGDEERGPTRILVVGSLRKSRVVDVKQSRKSTKTNTRGGLFGSWSTRHGSGVFRLRVEASQGRGPKVLDSWVGEGKQRSRYPYLWQRTSKRDSRGTGEKHKIKRL